MKEIVFVSEKSPYKFHTLTASLNMDGDLVFDDGEVYSTADGIGGRKVDERLFCTLERLARIGHWKAMDEIERWLLDRDVPFAKQRWDIK